MINKYIGYKKMDTDLQKIYTIAMADSAGLDVEGGTNMTEAEIREVYNEFRLVIDKASSVCNYFKSYIEEDKAKYANIDDIL